MTTTDEAAAGPWHGGFGRRFWFNLVGLAVLAPFATYWFQSHLQAYFTGAVLIGGGLTAWAALRLAWSVFEKLGKVDAAQASRRLLASPEASMLLLVAAGGLLVLWRSTGSLYLEYGGKGEAAAEFVLRVARAGDDVPYVPDLVLRPAERIVGRPFFWLGGDVPLRCTVVQPLRFEPRDCSLVVGRSTRLQVPGDFRPKGYHLLRIVPAPALFRELPRVGDEPLVRWDLIVERGDERYRLDDLRQQTVYAGGTGEDMALMLALEDDRRYEDELRRELVAADVDERSAARVAAVLASRAKRWETFQARAGDRLRISVQRTGPDDGGTMRTEAVGDFSVEVAVAAQRAQTIWLPAF